MKITAQALRVRQSGSGPPLLFVHGFLGGSFCWRLNTPAFVPHFTVITVDLPGHGPADAPLDCECSMRAHSQRLVQWIGEQNFDHLDVIASSWGGAIAMLAASQSRIVRSLVLAAPVNPWSAFGHERIHFFSSAFGGFLLRCGLPFSGRIHRIGVERMYGDVSRMPPGSVEGYRESLLQKGRAHNILSALRNWDKDVEVLRRAIPQVQARTLLIWGSRDGAVDPRSCAPLQKALPHCESAIIPGAGHLPFEETPEEFNRLALEFLSRN